MISKRSPFQEVTAFPALFFDNSNMLRENLIEKILNGAANSHKMSSGLFLKILTKITNIKSKTITKNRFNLVTENIASSDFRKKWYTRIEKSRKKLDLQSFYNYAFDYVVKKHKGLGVNSDENRDNFWEFQSKRDGKSTACFLKKDGFKKILNSAFELEISNELMALYIWSFWEAHVWYDLGGNQSQRAEPFLAQLQDILIEFEAESILKLCLPLPTKCAQKPDEHDLEIIQEVIEVSSEAGLETKNYIINADQPAPPSCISHNSPEELFQYAEMLMAIHELREETRKSLSENRYRDLRELSNKLEDSEALIDERRTALDNWLNSQGIDSSVLPSPPENLLQDRLNSEEYLNSLDRLINKNLADAEKSLEVSRENFSREIKKAGFEVPKEIEKIGSENEFKKFEKVWRPKIETAKVLERCVSGGIQNSAIETLDIKRRLKVYTRLLGSIEASEKIAQVFKFILNDPDAFRSTDPEAKQTFVSYIDKFIQMKIPLPVGTWLFIKEMGSEEILIELSTRGLFDLLEEIQDIDMGGLSIMIEDKLEFLPKKLANRINIYRLEDLDANIRMPHLIKSLLEGSEIEQTVKMLFRNLCELNKFGEAIYLASLYKRIEFSIFSNEELHDPLVMLMLEATNRGDGDNSILDNMLDDFEWLTYRDQDILSLLYMLLKNGKYSSYINLIYQASNEIETARQKYPILIDYLVKANEKRSSDKSEFTKVKQNVIDDGKKALDEFLRELDKASCYSSWPPAAKYQKYFRNILKSSLAKINKRNKLPDLNPDILIEDAKSKGLTEAKGTAIVNMRRYLQKQILRLNLIFEGSQVFDFQQLQKDYKDNFKDIEKEFASVIPQKTISLVYEAVLKEIS